MTLYIAGPITGIDDFVEQFATAEGRLRAAGYGVINPATLPHINTDDWQLCMREDIAEMMRRADGVALMRGWFSSRGAFAEAMRARALEMQIQCVESWLGVPGASVL